MSLFPCYGFTSARFRPERVRLAPPFRQVPEWSFKGVGYLPLIADGRVFLSFTKGAIAAYDEKTAAPIWQHALPRAYTPMVSAEGACLLRGDQVLVCAPDELRILAAATGEVLDCQPVPRLRLLGAVLDGKRIVCHFWDEAQYIGAYDTEQRKMVWRVPVPLMIGELVAAENVVCYLPANDMISAVDIVTGAVLWSFSLGNIGRYMDLERREQPGMTRGMPIVFAGMLITAVMGHQVLALDLHTGKQRWLRHVETLNPYTLTAYADKRLFVLGDDRLETFDACTGDLIQELMIGPELQRAGISGLFTRLGMTDEYIYCGDSMRSVLALHRERGTVDWSFRCRSRLASGDVPLIIGNKLYIVDGKGNLYVFEGDGK